MIEFGNKKFFSMIEIYDALGGEDIDIFNNTLTTLNRRSELFFVKYAGMCCVGDDEHAYNLEGLVWPFDSLSDTSLEVVIYEIMVKHRTREVFASEYIKLDGKVATNLVGKNVRLNRSIKLSSKRLLVSHSVAAEVCALYGKSIVPSGGGGTGEVLLNPTQSLKTERTLRSFYENEYMLWQQREKELVSNGERAKKRDLANFVRKTMVEKSREKSWQDSERPVRESESIRRLMSEFIIANPHLQA